VQPSFGPESGGFPVTVVGDGFAKPTTEIFFGDLPLRCPRFVNGNRIDGLAPPGMGTRAVSAVDSLAGSIPNATLPFQYVPGDSSTPLLDASPSDAAVAGTGDAGIGDAGIGDAGTGDAGLPCPGGSP